MISQIKFVELDFSEEDKFF